MAASAIPAQSVPAPRIQSVDALRGAIMMLMAIDQELMAPVYGSLVLEARRLPIRHL
jgi:uncharacterized membrane protein